MPKEKVEHIAELMGQIKTLEKRAAAFPSVEEIMAEQDKVMGDFDLKSTHVWDSKKAEWVLRAKQRDRGAELLYGYKNYARQLKELERKSVVAPPKQKNPTTGHDVLEYLDRSNYHTVEKCKKAYLEGTLDAERFEKVLEYAYDLEMPKVETLFKENSNPSKPKTKKAKRWRPSWTFLYAGILATLVGLGALAAGIGVAPAIIGVGGWWMLASYIIPGKIVE